MLTFNVLERVFFIRSAAYGTAFTIDHEGRQYLITAAHLLAPDAEREGIKIYRHKKWESLPVQILGTGIGEVDVAVLSAQQRLSSNLPLEAVKGGFILGQDVFFAGFPYKQFGDGGEVMRGLPLPFIKKGTLSAFDGLDEVKRIYIDAINNEGFSGGPVVFHSGRPNQLKVMGVVSKFRVEEEPVLNSDGSDSGLRVQFNTGIAIAYGMHHVLRLIERRPEGVPI